MKRILSYFGLTLLFILIQVSAYGQKKTKSTNIFLRKDLLETDPSVYSRKLYDENNFGFLSSIGEPINMSFLNEEQRKKLQYYTSSFNLNLSVNADEAAKYFSALGLDEEKNIVFKGILHTVDNEINTKIKPIELEVTFKNGVSVYRNRHAFALKDIVYARFDIEAIIADNNGIPIILKVENLTGTREHPIKDSDTSSILPFNLKMELEGYSKDRINYTSISNNQFSVGLDKKTMDLVVSVDAGNWANWAHGIELEWTHADDYKCGNSSSNPARYANRRSDNQIIFDFENNASNVILDHFDYRIPLVFERGVVAFRFRPILFKDVNRDTIIHGPWYPSGSNYTNASYPSNFKFNVREGSASPNTGNHIVHANDEINWSQSVSYSGYGIRNDQIKYYDVLDKPRQSLHRDPEDYTLFASEVIYDRLGEPAIIVPPAPVSISVEQEQSSEPPVEESNTSQRSRRQRGLFEALRGNPFRNLGRNTVESTAHQTQARTPQYRSDFRYIPYLNTPIENPENAYSWRNFDNYDFDTPLDRRVAVPMATTNGAAQYYSDNNPFKEGAEATLPNAHGYPFIQIERSVESSTKISRMGSVGDAYQLGSTHEQKFYELNPTQEELDRYLGNDAGFAANYRKKITLDNNQQISFSISDNKGRVVMTGLSGQAPAQLEALNSASNALKTETINVLNHDQIENYSGWSQRTARYEFFITTPQPITLKYKLTPESFSFDTCSTSNPDVCLNCLYELQLEFKNLETNQVLFSKQETIVPAQLFCNSPTRAVEFSFPSSGVSGNLPIGRYSASRILKLRSTEMQANLNSLVNTPCQDFFLTLPAVNRITPCVVASVECRSRCGEGKVDFRNNLRQYSDKKPEEIDNEVENYYQNCLAACNRTTIEEIINPIDNIKKLFCNDLSPGGQYAEHTLQNDDGTERHITDFPDNFLLSILNTGRNELPNSRNYRFPLKNHFNPKEFYLNNLGEVDYVVLDADERGPYTSFIESNGALRGSAFFELEDGRLKLLPQLLTVEHFVKYFKDSWANALLPYHPEYLTLYWYETNNAAKESMLFDQKMSRINTYAEAKNELGDDLINEEKIFHNDPLYNADDPELRREYRSLETKLFGEPSSTTTDLNLERLIVASIHCNNPETGIDVNDCLTRKIGTNSNTRVNDEEWIQYKNIFLSFKKKILECFIARKIADVNFKDPQQASFPFNRDMKKIDRKDEEGAPLDNLYGKKTKYFKNTAELLAKGECFNIVEDVCADNVDNLIQLMAECLQSQNQREFNQRCFTCPVSSDLTAFLSGLNRETPLNKSYSGNLFSGYPVPYMDDLMRAMNIPVRAQNIKWEIQSADEYSARAAIIANGTIWHYLQFKSIHEDAESAATGVLPKVHWDKIATIVCLNMKDDIDKHAFRFKAIYKQEFAPEIGAAYVFMEGMSLKADGSPGINFVNCAASQNQCSANSDAMIWSLIMNKLIEKNRIRLSGASLRLDIRGTDAEYYKRITKNFVRKGLNYTDPSGIDRYELKWVSSGETSESISGNLIFSYDTRTVSIPLTIKKDEGTIPVIDIVSNERVNFISHKVNPNHGNSCNFESLKLRFNHQNQFFTVSFNIPGIFQKQCCNILQAAVCTAVTEKTKDGLRQTRVCQPCCPEIPFIPVQRPSNPCENLLSMQTTGIISAGNRWVEQQREERKRQYNVACMGSPNEQFTIQIQNGIYQITLYYYDAAGNLIHTVPPEGVKPLSDDQVAQVALARERPLYASKIFPLESNHKMKSTYYYNTANRVVYSKRPDQGETKYFYDEYGRMRFVQDQNQLSAYGVGSGSRKKGGYILYDAKNRVSESGVIDFNESAWNAIKNTVVGFKIKHQELNNRISSAGSLSGSGNTRSDVIRIHYDKIEFVEASDKIPGGQRFLLNRKSAVTYHPDGNVNAFEHGKFYTYTLSGEVRHFLQINKMSAIPAEHQPKLISYVYDPFTPEAAEVHYQAGKSDQFYHRYHFYKNGKMKAVFTSTDRNHWKREALFSYRRDGSLSRTEIGEGLQGIDVIQTLDGKIKAINNVFDSPDKDPGKDGLADGPHPNIPPDLGGYVLNYFAANAGQHQADYAPIDNAAFDLNSGAFTNSNSLFNGFTNAIAQRRRGKALIEKNYDYDQLGRLVSNTNLIGGAPAWESSFTYDANGNFVNVKRNDQSNAAFDNLTYTLKPEKNQPQKVIDEIGATSYPFDMEGTTEFDFNGNGTLKKIRNGSENMEVEWNSAYRPVTINTNGKTARMYYDAGMNRSAELLPNTTTRYTVRDNSGNIMAIYNISGGSVELHSTPIYAEGRLAVYRHQKVLSRLAAENSGYHESHCGKRIYEFKSATGDVLTLYTDKKLHNGSNYINTILMEQDYMPYGLPMVDDESEEKLLAENYPFGFQGMEYDASCSDEEAGKRKYTTYYRLYDASLAMWLSPDPKANASQSPYFAFNGNPIMYTDEKGDVPNIIVGAGVGLVGGLISEGISYMTNPTEYQGGWNFVLRVGVSVAMGAATSGLSAFTAPIASNAARIGATVAIEVGGAVAQQILNNGIDGNSLGDGVLTAALTAGLASGATGLLSKLNSEAWNAAREAAENLSQNATGRGLQKTLNRYLEELGGEATSDAISDAVFLTVQNTQNNLLANTLFRSAPPQPATIPPALPEQTAPQDPAPSAPEAAADLGAPQAPPPSPDAVARPSSQHRQQHRARRQPPSSQAQRNTPPSSTTQVAPQTTTVPSQSAGTGVEGNRQYIIMHSARHENRIYLDEIQRNDDSQ